MCVVDNVDGRTSFWLCQSHLKRSVRIADTLTKNMNRRKNAKSHEPAGKDVYAQELMMFNGGSLTSATAENRRTSPGELLCIAKTNRRDTWLPGDQRSFSSLSIS